MMEEVLDEIKDEIRPSSDEVKELEIVEEKVLDKARDYSDEYNFEPRFCGSIAKKTWGKNKKDIDFFLLFDTKKTEEELEEAGLDVGKKIIEDLNGSWDIAYAEHPYVQGKVDDFDIDIVPAYKTDSDDIKSSVDRTPWHVRWVNQNLDDQQCDDVRLLKRFCKEHNLYGSSLKVRGFSGYLCELLIAEYNSFSELIKNAVDWDAGQIIDVENHYEDKKEIKNNFDNEPLIVVDPVDQNRNVASALSAEKFFLFRKKAEEFVEKPTKKRFYAEKKKPMTSQEIMINRWERGTDFVLIEFDSPDVHEDVLYPQMRKMNNRLQTLLQDEGFEVLRKDCWSDGDVSVLIIELEVGKLPKIDKRVGPPIYDNKNSSRFRERYGEEHNLLVEEGRWVVEYWRDFTDAVNFIANFLDRDSNSLQADGIPRHLSEEIEVSLNIASSDDAILIFEKNEGLRVKMKEYFEKDLA